ncbi:insulinase family protein [Xylocopilactobacillus apis]|uniref:Peptidase M16 n=1 Tax=Xylocopilactobacillus apis TaxID=2932183 RepID=A0AAU9CS09_9LACO|nr:insulinase family protein [Xylocopilactobacillus apis]BDR56737.1 peptidase M16 [Xylocopilactobacillus apis]
MNLVTENKIGIKKLKNGLTVKLIEKPNFKTFNVQMIVNFGSSDSLIDQVQIPPGSAHLIEHLLFHKKNHDMDYLFSQMGIDSNAYTTYNVTNFFYTTLKKDREYFKKSLEYLFELVLDAYFTNDLIKKEIEIISSEIKITEDDTDSDLYTELLANLYPKTPLSYDILGTEKTIRTVDKNLLKRLHEKFYQPQNIVLYVCGPISFSELIEVVESVANLDDQKDIELNSNYYYLPVKNKKSNFNNKLSKLVYGWSLPNLDLNYRDSIIFSLYLENMLGKRSQFFHRMYNDGVINDDFYYEFVVEKNFTVLFFSCLTEDPKKLLIVPGNLCIVKKFQKKN